MLIPLVFFNGDFFEEKLPAVKKRNDAGAIKANLWLKSFIKKFVLTPSE